MVTNKLPESIVVVPCYNEETRLRMEEFRSFAAENPGIQFFLVDDGSRDGTLMLLRQLEAEKPSSFRVIQMASNRGKAEAVRNGLLNAFEINTFCVGYWDADLSTPLWEIPRFCNVLKNGQSLIVFGARVKLMGREVERRPLRHYVGRIFATLASLTLDLPIYDTQCGAKMFRNVPEIRTLFEKPFVSKWIFDVEILARLIRAAQSRNELRPERILIELPLRRWVDVAGSKVRPGDFFRAIVELTRIWWLYLSGAVRSD